MPKPPKLAQKVKLNGAIRWRRVFENLRSKAILKTSITAGDFVTPHSFRLLPRYESQNSQAKTP